VAENKGEQSQAITVAKASDIPVGQMKGFTIEGKQILVANVNGEYYAMDAICSHEQGYLPAGHLRNEVVICPVHGAQFDVTTGCMVIDLPGKVHKNVNLDCRLRAGHDAMDLRTYDIVVDGNELKVLV
jgi:nitrite reductase/ring-hydroxylating ferredoxin subunit